MKLTTLSAVCAIFVSSFGIGACSGDSDEAVGDGDGDAAGDGDGDAAGDGDGDALPGTWEGIEALADDLNSCDAVTDCIAVTGYQGCSAVYVNQDADTTDLEAAIKRLNIEESGSEFVACIALCQPGVLSCTENKCTTTPGGPAGNGETEICL